MLLLMCHFTVPFHFQQEPQADGDAAARDIRAFTQLRLISSCSSPSSQAELSLHLKVNITMCTAVAYETVSVDPLSNEVTNQIPMKPF